MNRIPLKQFLFFFALIISFSAIVIAGEKDTGKSQKQTDGKNIIEMGETQVPLDLRWLIQEAMEHNPEIIAAQSA